MKIYTKTGDNRETGLYDGSRVFKNDPYISSLGEIDELNSILGIVISYNPSEKIKNITEELQKTLLRIGSDIVTPVEASIQINRMSSIDVLNIEQAIDELELKLPKLSDFILPGGTKTSSFLHQARSVARRAERRIVSIENINPELLKYINRLSDLLFVMARIENTQ